MSPEQAVGATPGPRSDLYSAGIVLFELLTGRVPFTADNPLALMRRHINEVVPDARTVTPELPAAVALMIARATAHDVDARTPTAAALLAELEASAVAAYGADWEKRSSIKKRVLAALAALGLLGATAVGASAAGTTGEAILGGGAGAWALVAGAGVLAALVLGGGFFLLKGNFAGATRSPSGAVALSTPSPAPGASPSSSASALPSPSAEPSATPSGSTPSSSSAPNSPAGIPGVSRSTPAPAPTTTFVVVAGKVPSGPAAGLSLSNARVFFLDCTAGCGFYSDGFPYYSPATAYPSGSAMDCRGTPGGTFSVFDQWDFNNGSSAAVSVTVQWAITWADGKTSSATELPWSIAPSSAGTHQAAASTAQDQPPIPAPAPGPPAPNLIGNGTYTLSWNNPDGSSHSIKAQQPMYWSCIGNFG